MIKGSSFLCSFLLVVVVMERLWISFIYLFYHFFPDLTLCGRYLGSRPTVGSIKRAVLIKNNFFLLKCLCRSMLALRQNPKYPCCQLKCLLKEIESGSPNLWIFFLLFPIYFVRFLLKLVSYSATLYGS